MLDKEFQELYKPQPHEIVVHNLNIDKVEVHEKTHFLQSYPYEIPC